MKTPTPLIQTRLRAMALMICLAASAGAAEEIVMFDTWNNGAVESGPTAKCTIVIYTPFLVTYASTYHWNNGAGTREPGTISLRHDDGTVYGPWATSGSDGQGGVANAIWECHPGQLIKPGHYEIVDSDNDTWAKNEATDGRGFAKIKGIAKQAEAAPALPTGDRCISRHAAYKVSSQYSDKYPPLYSLLTGAQELYPSRLPDTHDIGPEFAFCSALEANPHIIIDLGSTALIDGLRIENRRRQFQDRAEGLTLALSLDGKDWKEFWTAHTVQPVWRITLPKPVAARFAKLSLKRTDYLHLAHVEIFGDASALVTVTPAESAGPAIAQPVEFAALPPLTMDVQPSDKAQRIDFHGRLTIEIPGGLLKKSTTLKIKPRAKAPPDAAGQYRVLSACDISLGDLRELSQAIGIEMSYDSRLFEKNKPLQRQIQALSWDSDKKLWFGLEFTLDEKRECLVLQIRQLATQLFIIRSLFDD